MMAQIASVFYEYIVRMPECCMSLGFFNQFLFFTAIHTVRVETRLTCK